MEPITIFSRKADPALVARQLRELHPSVELDGPEGRWRRAVFHFGEGLARKTLTLTHDPASYTEPELSRGRTGMAVYFNGFPHTARKQRVMSLISTLGFALGALFEPKDHPSGDPRFNLVCDIAVLVDGVLISPSALRDAHGRILFGRGEAMEDADAVWPRGTGEVSTPDPRGAGQREASP